MRFRLRSWLPVRRIYSELVEMYRLIGKHTGDPRMDRECRRMFARATERLLIGSHLHGTCGSILFTAVVSGHSVVAP